MPAVLVAAANCHGDHGVAGITREEGNQPIPSNSTASRIEAVTVSAFITLYLLATRPRSGAKALLGG